MLTCCLLVTKIPITHHLTQNILQSSTLLISPFETHLSMSFPTHSPGVVVTRVTALALGRSSATVPDLLSSKGAALEMQLRIIGTHAAACRNMGNRDQLLIVSQGEVQQRVGMRTLTCMTTTLQRRILSFHVQHTALNALELPWYAAVGDLVERRRSLEDIESDADI